MHVNTIQVAQYQLCTFSLFEVNVRDFVMKDGYRAWNDEHWLHWIWIHFFIILGDGYSVIGL